jgi:hypothetical protein
VAEGDEEADDPVADDLAVERERLQHDVEAAAVLMREHEADVEPEQAPGTHGLVPASEYRGSGDGGDYRNNTCKKAVVKPTTVSL